MSASNSPTTANLHQVSDTKRRTVFQSFSEDQPLCLQTTVDKYYEFLFKDWERAMNRTEQRPTDFDALKCINAWSLDRLFTVLSAYQLYLWKLERTKNFWGYPDLSQHRIELRNCHRICGGFYEDLIEDLMQRETADLAKAREEMEM